MGKKSFKIQSLITFNVLVACEESQAISGEIRRIAKALDLEERYQIRLRAWSCDLLATSAEEDDDLRMTGSSWHLEGDVTRLLKGGKDLADNAYGISEQQKEAVKVAKSSQGWDMIISNPPCTYLAVSGARWYHDSAVERNQDGRTENEKLEFHPRYPMRKCDRAKSIRFIMTIAMNPCKYIIIENPIGTLKSNLKSNVDYNVDEVPIGYTDYFTDERVGYIKDKIDYLNKKIELSSFNKEALEEQRQLLQEQINPLDGGFPKFKELVSINTLESSSYPDLVNHLINDRLPSWIDLKKLARKDGAECKWLVEPPKHKIRPHNQKITQIDDFSEYSQEDSNIDDSWRPTINPYPIQVQPYDFGEPMSKRTCFWVKGITHPLTPTTPNVENKGDRVHLSSGKSQPKWYSDAFTMSKSTAERRTMRSKTFKGIATAVVIQWVLWALDREIQESNNKSKIENLGWNYSVIETHYMNREIFAEPEQGQTDQSNDDDYYKIKYNIDRIRDVLGYTTKISVNNLT